MELCINCKKHLQKKSQWYIFEPPLGKQGNTYSSIMTNK